MDYTTLYEAWKKEKENNELQRLDKRFYVDLSEHVRVHREELQMLDDKTLRAKLAAEESERIEKLFKDLLRVRHGKILEAVSRGKHLSIDLLTSEEEAIYRDILLDLEKVKDLEKDVLRGHAPRYKEVKGVEKPKRTILVRFLQAIPAIVGSNTQVYGPFNIEDVASLPVENAESLIKHGIAVKLEPE